MKNQRYYFILALLFLLILVTGCASGSSESDDHDDNDSTPATDIDDGQASNLIVFTEIMYNPADGSPEFLELVNNSQEAMDVRGYYFSKGIEYTFKNETVLQPGEIIVLSDVDPDVDNSLELRLPPGTQFFAPYDGQLSNSGEEIELRDATGKKVCEITYTDESPWPVAADGSGYTLVVADPTLSSWGNTAADWLASAEIGGSPGYLDVSGDDDSTPGSGIDDGQASNGIVFTEIMYYPADDSPEFLELINDSQEAVDISGYYFSEGIEYTFKNETVLQPGEIIVLSDVDPDVDNSLELRLPPGTQFFAPYDGQLSNSGEEIKLRDATGKKVCDIAYTDESPWPVAASGFGYAMVVADPTLSYWGNTAADWLPSAEIGGSPGTLDVSDGMPDKMVRINEVLTHTDGGGGDAIELYNEGGVAVDVSGWYLSDDKDEFDKFRIPDGTVIEPYGYLIFYEIYDATNSANIERFLFGDAFQLSSHGDKTFLFAVENGSLSGYIHGFTYGEVENNISFGRYINASGNIQFIAQKGKTLGAPNAGPYVDYIVVSEIMYHADGVVAPCNFVEITNTGNNETILFDPNNARNTWQIKGIDFAFDGQVSIKSQERIVLIAQEPLSVLDFKEHYQLGSEIQVHKYEGVLKANREVLEVLKPEDPLEDGTVPHMVVDRAGYDEDNPGLEDADGSGVSLERIDLRAYGDDYTNWALSVPGGTPGY